MHESILKQALHRATPLRSQILDLLDHILPVDCVRPGSRHAGEAAQGHDLKLGPGLGVLVVESREIHSRRPADRAAYSRGGLVVSASAWSTPPMRPCRAWYTIWCCCTRDLPWKAADVTTAA